MSHPARRDPSPRPGPGAAWPDDLGTLTVVADASALAATAAQAAVSALSSAVGRHGDATWVLAGGSTPKAAYELLAAGPPHASVGWDRIRVAVGDERAVGASDPDSNWGQATAALLDPLGLPAEHRLAPRGELGAEQAAADYARQLDALPKTVAGWPRLDVVWLGTGEDGHCLSLFPGNPATEATGRLVTAVHDAPKPPPDRLSLTLPALRGVACCLILAAGAGKADALAKVRAGHDLPVARAAREIVTAGGTVTWLLDSAAAGRA